MNENKRITVEFLERLNRDANKLAKFAMLDVQEDIKLSIERQKEAKNIIKSKLYH